MVRSLQRFVALLAIGFATVSFAFAAGQQPAATDESGTITLTFYRFGTASHNSYLEPLLAAFGEAHPEIEFDHVLVVDGGYAAMTQQVLLGAAAGNPPDIAQIGNSFIRAMVDNASPHPIDEMMASDSAFDVDSIYPAMLSLGEIDGKHYSIPLGTSTPVFYYNEQAFIAAGLDPEAPPRTWDEVTQAAIALKAAGYEGVIWAMTHSDNYIFQAMAESAGGRLGTTDGRRATFDQGGALEAAEYKAALIRQGLMPTTREDNQLFLSGRLGMLIRASGSIPNFERNAPFPVRVATIPTPDGSAPSLPAGGNAIMMFTKDHAKQQAAWTFMRWLTGAEATRILSAEHGYVAANRSVVTEISTDEGRSANLRIAVAQAPYVTPWHSWPGANSTRVSRLLEEAIQSIALQREEPRAALSRAAIEANELLRR